MSGLNFRQLPVANGTAFSKIFKKDDNLTRYTQIFETFFPEFSFHSTLLPEFLEFSVEWFAFRKFNSFRISWKLFRKIAAPFAAVSKFSKVLVEWAKVTDRARVQVTFCYHISFSRSPLRLNNIRGFWMQSVSAFIFKAHVYPHYFASVCFCSSKISQEVKSNLTYGNLVQPWYLDWAETFCHFEYSTARKGGYNV